MALQIPVLAAPVKRARPRSSGRHAAAEPPSLLGQLFTRLLSPLAGAHRMRAGWSAAVPVGGPARFSLLVPGVGTVALQWAQ